MGEIGPAAQIIGALVVVLALIPVTVWVLRHVSSGQLRGHWGRGQMPRLELRGSVAVDNKRRLVLVRRDGIEHLLLVGGQTDLVVESGIAAESAGAAAEGATAPRRPAGPAAPRHSEEARARIEPRLSAAPGTPRDVNPDPPLAAQDVDRDDQPGPDMPRSEER